MCSKETKPGAQNLSTIVDSIVNMIGGGGGPRYSFKESTHMHFEYLVITTSKEVHFPIRYLIMPR